MFDVGYDAYDIVSPVSIPTIQEGKKRIFKQNR